MSKKNKREYEEEIDYDIYDDEELYKKNREKNKDKFKNKIEEDRDEKYKYNR